MTKHVYASIGKSSIALTVCSILTATPLFASDLEKPQQDAIEVIEVNGKRNQANSEVTLETEKLLKIAGLDHDPLGAVYSLPGVVYAGGDDGGEPAIRGSSPDDNAFYIDDMPVTYVFHLFGDSIFNENVVRDFALHPAAFDSRYGNATGGVFDVKLRDPRNQELSTTVDFSMLKAGFMTESGVSEDQAFYVSYRRSLIHLFIDEEEEDEGYTIYKAPVSDDYQAKYQWLIGDNHKLTFNLTGANDKGGINISKASEQGRVDPDTIGDLEIKQGFDTQGISWQYFGDNEQLFQLNASHTNEKSKQSYGQGQYINVDTDKYSTRFSYQLNLFNDHKLITGLDWDSETSDYSYDAIIYYCTDHEQDCESKKGERTQDTDKLKANNYALYINDIWQFDKNWQLELGVRAEYNDYVEQNFVHPRAALSWFVTPDLTLSAKAGTYSRFPDLDTVLRKIGNPKLKSPKAKHYGINVTYQLSDIWQTSVDVYYKDLGDLARSLDDDDPNSDLHYSNDLTGTAKGIEWLIKRDTQDGWYGWASISWSKSDRTDTYTNTTTEYYLDTPLLANLVANYQFNERWDFGVKLSIRSGQKYTPITALRDNPDHDGFYLPVYGELNSKTLPIYHRLDIQANYKTSIMGQKAEWSFALLNALGSDNFSGYYYAPDGNETLTDYKIEGEKGLEPFASIGLKMTF